MSRDLMLYNLVVEITRKCNMKCDHCLRGPAQRVNLSREHIGAMLQDVSSINMLTITGGEPSLNAEGINYLVDVLIWRSIYVGSFYIVTNGTRSSAGKAFLDAVARLYNWSNDGGSLDMSTGQHHEGATCETGTDRQLRFNRIQEYFEDEGLTYDMRKEFYFNKEAFPGKMGV